MTVEEMRAELKELGDRIHRRWEEKMEGADPNIYLPADWFATDEERARMHELKMALPTFKEERAAAQERIRQRLAERRRKRDGR